MPSVAPVPLEILLAREAVLMSLAARGLAQADIPRAQHMLLQLAGGVAEGKSWGRHPRPAGVRVCDDGAKKRKQKKRKQPGGLFMV